MEGSRTGFRRPATGGHRASRREGKRNRGRTASMQEQKKTKENVVALAQEIDRIVGILEGRTVAKQWIRRSVFEKRIEGLLRRSRRVKAQNAMVCWWLRPELRALGASVKKLKENTTEKRRCAANAQYVKRRLQGADSDPVLKRLHSA